MGGKTGRPVENDVEEVAGGNSEQPNSANNPVATANTDNLVFRINRNSRRNKVKSARVSAK